MRNSRSCACCGPVRFRFFQERSVAGVDLLAKFFGQRKLDVRVAEEGENLLLARSLLADRCGRGGFRTGAGGSFGFVFRLAGFAAGGERAGLASRARFSASQIRFCRTARSPESSALARSWMSSLCWRHARVPSPKATRAKMAARSVEGVFMGGAESLRAGGHRVDQGVEERLVARNSVQRSASGLRVFLREAA